MRLIDADAICKECIEGFLVATCEECVIKEYKLNKAVDAVPVVRCKDCKFFKYGDYCTEDKMEHSHARENDFCSYGERKDGEG